MQTIKEGEEEDLKTSIERKLQLQDWTSDPRLKITCFGSKNNFSSFNFGTVWTTIHKGYGY